MTPKSIIAFTGGFAGLYAAGQLGLRYKILHPSCDWFMDAISAYYRAATAPESTSSPSVVEAAAILGKFLEANRNQLPKVKGSKALTQDASEKAVGLRLEQSHGKRIRLKSSLLQNTVLPYASAIILQQLATAG